MTGTSDGASKGIECVVSCVEALANLPDGDGSITEGLREAMPSWAAGDMALLAINLQIVHVLTNSGWSLALGHVRTTEGPRLAVWSENEGDEVVGLVEVFQPDQFVLDKSDDGKLKAAKIPLSSYDLVEFYDQAEAQYVIRIPSGLLRLLLEKHDPENWMRNALSIYQCEVAEWKLLGIEPGFRATMTA